MANLTLLVVEDNTLQQRILNELCATFDYEVFAVTTGEMALEAVKDGKYCAVIMDLGLPKMSGLECAREIRKMNIDIPIIALTARKDEAVRQECMDAGMNDYMSKPFDVEELRSILLRWTYRPSKPNLKLLKSDWQDDERRMGS